MALDRDKKLVLGRGQANRARLHLAPVHEPAQARTEGQQVLKVAGRHLGHSFTVVQGSLFRRRPGPPGATRPIPNPSRVPLLPPRVRVDNIYRATIYSGRQPPGLPAGPVAGAPGGQALPALGRQISMTATTDVRVRRVY